MKKDFNVIEKIRIFMTMKKIILFILLGVVSGYVINNGSVGSTHTNNESIITQDYVAPVVEEEVIVEAEEENVVDILPLSNVNSNTIISGDLFERTFMFPLGEMGIGEFFSASSGEIMLTKLIYPDNQDGNDMYDIYSLNNCNSPACGSLKKINIELMNEKTFNALKTKLQKERYLVQLSPIFIVEMQKNLGNTGIEMVNNEPMIKEIYILNTDNGRSMYEYWEKNVDWCENIDELSKKNLITQQEFEKIKNNILNRKPNNPIALR